MIVDEPRSQASHRFYFACLKNAFDNLPETISHLFTDPEDLRHYALIETGNYTDHPIKCATKDEAMRWVSRLMRDPQNIYCRFFVNDDTIVRREPKSQSTKAMGKQAFEKSKADVLELCSILTGIDVAALKKEATESTKPNERGSHV
jgi:hypothetical protein